MVFSGIFPHSPSCKEENLYVLQGSIRQGRVARRGQAFRLSPRQTNYQEKKEREQSLELLVVFGPGAFQAGRGTLMPPDTNRKVISVFFQ